MRVTVERLRWGVLAVAGALLVGVLLLLAYARWQVRRIGRDLPGKLGIEIQQSSNGFTFSKSQGGRTLFTLHAAKTVQFKDGRHAMLHDVGITLYGATGGLVDHIAGDDFDYDSVAGIVRADGSVQIDLQVPKGANAGENGAPAGAGVSTVHVETSGLTFNEKTGMASTAQKFAFSLPQAHGSATGASFDSNAGVLILESDVVLDTSLNGSPLSLRAHHAQYNRASQLLYLLNDETEYAQNRGASDQATVYFRPDGSASAIKAQGHVTILGSEGQRITSAIAHVLLNAQSQPQQVQLEGGMLYVADDALRQIHGAAVSGTLSFGPGGILEKAHLETAVSIVDQEKPRLQSSHPGAPADKPYLSLVREARASQMDVDFAAGADRRPVAERLLATGAASIKSRTLYAAGPPEETSVEGDRLLANLQDGVALSSLQGTGHTKLALTGTGGSQQTSTGDTLLLAFAPPPPLKPGKTGKTGKLGQAKRTPSTPLLGSQVDEPVQLQSLQSLEQTGHVTVVQMAPAQPPSPPRTVTAAAERLTYDAATQLARLYGGPQGDDPRVQETGGDLTAKTIEFERVSGDITATGQVKATYRQSPAQPGASQPGALQPGVSFGGAEPIHVVAARAHVNRATDVADFYGDAGADARLWQDADSISAPVLELSQARQTLNAHDLAGGSRARPVTAVFTSAASGSAPKPSGAAGQSSGSVVRVGSRTLLYSGVENKAVFDGGVVAEVPSGIMRSSSMEVDLASSSPTSSSQKPQQGQQVDHIIARGEYELEQPGRQGTGSQLVYTAQDGRFVLTGSNSLPPRLVDRVRATVTGSSLIFNDRDDSVIVSGGSSKAVTETRTAK